MVERLGVPQMGAVSQPEPQVQLMIEERIEEQKKLDEDSRNDRQRPREYERYFEGDK